RETPLTCAPARGRLTRLKAHQGGPQMRKTLTGLLAGLSLTLAGGVSIHAASAEELTIFWAEWDPANYLQELANEYTKETGVTVTVQTTPWADFQTKTFAELNAHGDAYDMVVGEQPVAGRSIRGRALRRSHRLREIARHR